ncbi:uncharacterized membrane protein YhaH (DUF805 family) [Curtobacterium luteum]|uniref:Uncharacterized membrane protein YhaH (DUF805 family) n=1 Tax=Curtobacterium luteum TaxID=33881 RepID=A0A8H9GDI2_9MICO|nr:MULTISPECIES: DUF805 domain-containing protein [Curtobacterium]MBM7802117.1 uncharacterized membrane protein YhaH (DUF805 family) [Curtobacterium luteum]NUU52227.1 DUF805 domain-containing protein [Curtobacterium luteum]GGL04116.1 hypothetical protein GCM10009769_22910 [Curtobacterium luteum]
MSDQYPPQNPYGQEPAQNPYGQQSGQNPYGQQPQYGQPAPTGPNGEPPLWAPWYGISFPNAIKRFFKKYVRFDGRASRSEFWWWYLANVIVTGVLYAIYGIGAGTSQYQTVSTTYGSTSTMTSPSALFVIGGILLLLWGLATIIPNLALAWRRLHDANFAGPFIFLGLIPVVGGLILLVLYLLPSKPEGARFDQPQRG